MAARQCEPYATTSNLATQLLNPHMFWYRTEWRAEAASDCGRGPGCQPDMSLAGRTCKCCQRIGRPGCLYSQQMPLPHFGSSFQTSGLDTSTAVSVISSIRDLAKSSSTGLGIMMSIHQPSLDILQLIDHFLLLSSGRSVFFGTLAEARTYFDQLGFQVPVEGTPTDHYLMLTDTTFPASARASTTDFPAAFRQSLLGTGLRHTVKQSGTIKETMLDDPRAVSSHRMYASSSWRQYTSLVRRNFQVGMRDLSLFWMQMVLHRYTVSVLSCRVPRTFHFSFISVRRLLSERTALTAF